MSWTVRRAGAADAEEIARINVASWRHAYRGIVPDAVLDRMLPESRVPGWRRWLALPAPAAVFVAVDATGRIGAYCGVDAVREEGDRHADLPTGELCAIYVDPPNLGTGAGRAVHDAGVWHLAEQGFRYAVLWVLEANTSARRFYRSRGWRADGGSKQYEAGEAQLPEVRYARFLPATRSRYASSV
ncbi:GNAT family N-acetyltransferase [Gandjariella thermophila]|nr:GNAT family N-acetyltransferase [Gandjariella thermophila]